MDDLARLERSARTTTLTTSVQETSAVTGVAPQRDGGLGAAPMSLLARTPLPVANQHDSYACTAFAVTAGMALRAGVTKAEQRPSAAHAYCLQRQEECATTRRCDCGPSCGGVCNETCGSVLDVLLGVAEAGLASERTWPSSNLQDKALSQRAKELPRVMRLKLCEWLGKEARVVAAYLRQGFPVVCTLKLFSNQWDFFVHGKSGGEAVFPGPSGVLASMGHCVLLTGIGEDGFQARNSFGPDWGDGGNFVLPFRLINDAQVFALAAIVEVA